MRYTDDFVQPLQDLFDLDSLEADPGTIYGASPDFRLAYVNTAFDRFCAENGGPAGGIALGTSLVDLVEGPLRDFYRDRFSHAATTGAVPQFDYECSSAATFRRFRMSIFRVGDRGNLLIANRPIVETPRGLPAAAPPDEAGYRTPEGILAMCSHCRCARHVADGRWDLVPAWIARQPPRVSHGLCPPCAAYYLAMIDA